MSELLPTFSPRVLRSSTPQHTANANSNRFCSEAMSCTEGNFLCLNINFHFLVPPSGCFPITVNSLGKPPGVFAGKYFIFLDPFKTKMLSYTSMKKT